MVTASVKRHKENLVKISDSIWALAGIAFNKPRSSKVLTMTMVDPIENPKLIEKVNEEFKTRKGDKKYEPMIAGPLPIGNN